MNSTLYDTSFIFELTIHDGSELALETLLFRAVDSNFPFPDVLIGSYEMELGQVINNAVLNLHSHTHAQIRPQQSASPLLPGLK